MDQLTKMIEKRSVGTAVASMFGVLALLAVLGVGDARASSLKTTATTGTGVQVAMLGEAVRDGELDQNRGASLDSAASDVSIQPSDGYAIILWDEPGQGKPGGGTASLTDNLTVNVTVNGK